MLPEPVTRTDGLSVPAINRVESLALRATRMPTQLVVFSIGREFMTRTEGLSVRVMTGTEGLYVRVAKMLPHLVRFFFDRACMCETPRVLQFMMNFAMQSGTGIRTFILMILRFIF
jgi:hypothetical protein